MKNLRVLQLIDSLRPGGAEKMAVNIANALLPQVKGSFLCCTRKEGMLKEEIKPEVGYLFLNKKNSLDLQALLKLKRYIKENKIDIVHAHSTSFFLAGMLKLTGSRFNLIWHDHYGESENLEKREFKILKKFSRLFNGIISVNTALKDWAKQNLECKNVIELKNFVPEPDPARISNLKLKGDEKAFKIICVANLRPQKDHLTLLKAFEALGPGENVSLHLIGEDPKTDYSGSILKALKKSPLKEKIFYYGEQKEILPLLHQADLGVLPSRSEGLPLALLEYGMAGLAVVCTNVGNCSSVIGNYGIVVEAGNLKELSEAIRTYIDVEDMKDLHAKGFQENVIVKYSEKIVVDKIAQFYCK